MQAAVFIGTHGALHRAAYRIAPGTCGRNILFDIGVPKRAAKIAGDRLAAAPEPRARSAGSQYRENLIVVAALARRTVELLDPL